MASSADRRAERIAETIVNAVFTPASVMVHLGVIVVWTAAESYPWATLVTVLSMEAIFLTLLVGLGQRATDRRLRAHDQATNGNGNHH